MPFNNTYGQPEPSPMDTPQKLLKSWPRLHAFDPERGHACETEFMTMLENHADTFISFARNGFGCRRPAWAAKFAQSVSPFDTGLPEADLLTALNQPLDSLQAALDEELLKAQDRLAEVDAFIKDRGLRTDETTRRLLLVLCTLFAKSPNLLPNPYVSALVARSAPGETADTLIWPANDTLVLDWTCKPDGVLLCKPLRNDAGAERTLTVRVVLPCSAPTEAALPVPAGEWLWVLRVGNTPMGVTPCLPVPQELSAVRQLGGICPTTHRPSLLHSNGLIEMGDPRLQSFFPDQTAFAGLYCAGLAFIAIREAGGIVTNLPALSRDGRSLCALHIDAAMPGSERLDALLSTKEGLAVWSSEDGALHTAEDDLAQLAQKMLDALAQG